MSPLLEKIYETLSQEGLFSFACKVLIFFASKYFLSLMNEEKRFKAVKLGRIVVKMLPRKLSYYRRLARWFKAIGNDELATYALGKGLELITSVDDLMEIGEKKIEAKFSFYSKYMYLGGTQNLGCFEHTRISERGNEKYLTKISLKSDFKLEKLFYIYIYKQFPQIREFSPRLINLIELDSENLVLITLQKIEGDEPRFNEKTIKDVIRANKIITSIKFEEIKDIIPNPNFNMECKLFISEIPNHPFAAMHSFVSIHKKSTNQQLFNLVYKRMLDKKYSGDSYNLMKRLENIVFTYQLFNKIDPEIHYSLQHGDFYKYNMLMDKKNGKLYILDWGNMRVGPKWVDLAGFFGMEKLPFHKINEDYLLKNEENGRLETIEKVLFLYSLIIAWFVVFTKSEFDEGHDLYLRPAVEAIEAMSMEIRGVNQKSLGI